jgi:hypothetical protein
MKTKKQHHQKKRHSSSSFSKHSTTYSKPSTLSKNTHQQLKSSKNVIAKQTPSHTSAKGKKNRVIIQGAGQEFPHVILGATPHNLTEQGKKSKIYRTALSNTDSSVTHNMITSMGNTTSFTNSPNSRYPYGKKIANTRGKKDHLSAIPGGVNNMSNPIGIFSSRAKEVGKATNL